ncbi:hypothetical protein [Bacillus mesophilum]|uniref:Uncharacterized protein n=1 Tax=Bacillus mesophilum TaxID=1071718 RepID=A0A7V7UXU3_9BACI|nr:hypothetical protein [Bacillus mesophilum]KAB2332923.1 hypothetical protein F7732_12645 [Bacillus mesophilum]
MQRKLITIVDSVDPDWVPTTELTVLIAPEIIAEYSKDEGLNFRVYPKPIGDVVDRALCKLISIRISKEPDFEWLAKASLVDVVRKYAIF